MSRSNAVALARGPTSVFSIVSHILFGSDVLLLINPPP